MEGLPSYETVKKFRLLPSELTLEEGELTPTMKVKRRVVESKYADLIASMYNE
jgi:long-chain acyl-CoA synthetase